MMEQNAKDIACMLFHRKMRKVISILVTDLQEAISNILRFEAQLDGSSDLRARLAYARSWYAHPHEEDWCFGPSKFIGYQGMTAKEYVNEESRDGRRTERQLGEWFIEIPPQDPLHGELSRALHTFLRQYGKTPSSLSRINVSRELYEARTAKGGAQLHRAVADLLILVARQLPTPERLRVRAAL
jgi:hypothetical protein